MAISGTCQYCACTDDRGCEDGCSWMDDTHTLCSLCHGAQELAIRVLAIFGAVGPLLRPPVALPVPAWTDLTGDQQQVLVMAHRRTAEAMRDALMEGMTDEAIDAIVATRGLLQFLTTHCPQALRDDEPLELTVIRLLEPHVGRRIVIPNGVVA